MDKIRQIYDWFSFDFEVELDDNRKFNAHFNLIELIIGITALILLVLFCSWLINQAAALLLPQRG